MKKITALALALILTFSLSSCGNNGTSSNDNSGSNSGDSAGKKQTIKLVIGAGHTVGSMEYLDSLENFFKPEVAKRVSENTDYEIEWTDAYGTVAGLSETVTKYQRCTVHFYRNIFSVVPKSKVKIVVKMLKAIHAQESKKASREKAKAVVAELRAMKLKEAAKKVEDGIEETLTYCDFPSEHWTRIRTNNVIERLNRETRRRTRVVGTFPDGNSALMLVCARLRHVAGTQWGCKKYMNMKHLEAVMDDASVAG